MPWSGSWTAVDWQIMDWLTWLRLILISGVVGAGTAFTVFKLFGDYYLRDIVAKLKAGSDIEIKKLKVELTKDVEQYRARLDLSHTARKEVSQCLSHVNIAFSELHPIVAGQSLDGEERKEWIESLQKAADVFNAKLQEWAIFLEPVLYDVLERCYGGADSECSRLKEGSEKPDRARTVDLFRYSYNRAGQLLRGQK
jgi:hypothetical protein